MVFKNLLPKVTVIIPCYNREKFVKTTIDSALSQTYPNIEIVAVDDGSTDGTRHILESYGEKIRILEHPGRINKGQSAAINLAVRQTDSKYVAILDSDDVWMPKKIERQVEFLEKHPEIGLVYANGIAIDENGNHLYNMIREGHTETNNPVRTLLECHFNLPSNALVCRTAFNKVGEFDENLRSAQDHDMVVRLSEVAKLAYINETLWFYRKHSNTQSRQHAIRRWELGFRILDKACKRYNYGINVRRKRLAVLNFRIGQCLCEEGRLFQGAIRFVMSGILDPMRAIKVLTGIENITGPH